MRLRFWVGLAAVLLVAVGSVVAALNVRSREDDRFHTTQREEALRAARQAEAVARLSVGELAGAAAFIQADPDLNAHEFRVIGGSLLRRGALNAFVFLPQVRDSERPAFERAHFPIRDRAGLGRLRPAAARAVYYPVTYAVAAQTGGATPLGYDVGHDVPRGGYLRRARDSGRSTATGVMPLLIGGFGINVFHPVYRNGAPTATVAQRRRALLGFAGGAFRVEDLAAAAFAALPKPVDAQIQVDGSRVIGRPGTLNDPAGATIHVADQNWLLVASDPDRPGIAFPLLLGGVGVALALLLGALILIWSRNERMQELQRLADHDSLTGLKNRRRFEEELGAEIARSRRRGTMGALLILDVDEFKEVNDSLGHRVGDRVIQQIASVLAGRARETDVLARLGGDEFAVVLPEVHDADDARAFAEQVRDAIRDRVQQPEGIEEVTVSVGIALFGEGTGADLDSVQSDADAAMYSAKDEGRDRVRVAG